MLSRRQILWRTGALASVAVAASQWQALAQTANFVIGPAVKPTPLQQISRHVWMIEAADGFPTPDNQGLMANITFIEGSNGVLVFDSGASLQIARMAVEQWRARGGKPVTAIVNSHYHGDHWLGNHGFVEAYGKDLPIYAHPESRKAMAGLHGSYWLESMVKWTNGATMGTEMVLPNRDANHGDTLSLGDVTLKLHHYGVAHTPGDLCLEVVEDRVMCVGDVLMDRRIANMDEGSYLGSFKTFDALEANAKTKIWLPGHGKPGPDVLRWQRELFQGIYDACTAAVKAGEPVESARSKALADPRVASKISETKGFDSNIGKYVSLAYLEAEQAEF